MAVETVKFASENTLKAVVSESKKYSKKVSAVTVTTDTTTDANAIIYKFTQNGEEVGSVKVDKENFNADMQEITADEVIDMFKEDIILTVEATGKHLVITNNKGLSLNNGDIIKEGWILTLTAPITNPDNNSESINVIIVNGSAISITDTEDGTGKTGTYIVTTEDEKKGIVTVGISYTT